MVAQLAEAPRSPQPRPYRALGARVAELRRVSGMSQRDLAQHAGISVGYPGSIEAGRVRPDPDILRRIATVLEADYAELAALAGYMDRHTGPAVIEVPADNLDLRREAASLPARLLRPWLTALRAMAEQSAHEVTALDPDADGEPITDAQQ